MTPRIQKILFTVAALLLSSGILCAQEEKRKSWLELFESTGFVGYMLVALSIAGTTLVIEHSVSIKRERLAPPQLADELEALIEEENYDQAIDLCTEDGSYMSNLISAALRMRHAGYEEMVGVLEQVAAEEGFKLNAKISYLSLVGNVGPLLGLLGTVTGMISSFQVIENLKAPTPKDLAKGVYESLVNTTIGLFIAILFLTSYFVFKNKVTKMTLSVNLQSVDLLKSMVTKMTAKH